MKRSFQTNDLCLYYLLKISSLRPSSLHNFRDGIKDSPRLSPQKCANLQDYQLAVTIYATTGEDETTNVFGRINSGGKQLSAQERRQAGVIFPFAEMVRKIAAELRGD